MSTRITETHVTFTHSFRLSSVEGLQPAGTYRLDAEEERKAGLPFQTVDRLTLFLHLPPRTGSCDEGHIVCVDPAELADALATDAA
jgi:hypothetical protein